MELITILQPRRKSRMLVLVIVHMLSLGKTKPPPPSFENTTTGTTITSSAPSRENTAGLQKSRKNYKTGNLFECAFHGTKKRSIKRKFMLVQCLTSCGKNGGSPLKRTHILAAKPSATNEHLRGGLIETYSYSKRGDRKPAVILCALSIE